VATENVFDLGFDVGKVNSKMKIHWRKGLKIALFVAVFVAVLGPEKHTGDHLKALARISRILRDDAVCERLLAAPDAATALALFIEEDDRR